MTFVRWLKNQKHRHDPVGDLSRDLIEDSEFTGRSFRALKKRMVELKACDNAILALYKANKEYKETP